MLDELLSLEVLTRREYDDVRSEKRAAYRRSEAVLNLVRSEDQCDSFLTALKRTGQQHVVNFVTQNGGQNSNTMMYNLHCCDQGTSPEDRGTRVRGQD